MNGKIKVLYVDDEPINLQIFEISFNRSYEVFTARSGKSGLEELEKDPGISVIISDMKMPVMNGIEFIKKAREQYPGKKFYILTGFDITDEIQHALETGLIIKYFRKPFDLQEIDTAIKEAISQDG